MINSFQLCVDAAAESRLELILIGGHAVNARGYLRTTMDVDFLIPKADLENWKAILASNHFHLIHETKAFAQFQPSEPDGFRVDLMLVDQPTFAKLHAGSEVLQYGPCRVRVAGVLHLIALKLHATRTWDRAVQGKDYYDILQLIRINHVKPDSPELQEILTRYATPSIKERLLSDLQRAL
ncbi:MAG: nucleotidyl transferase AbiEii/AbiGii toxin family protein [Terrimicrobiaceae bacterium]